MITLKNKLGDLGWGLSARQTDEAGFNGKPVMVYYYMHEYQQTIYDADFLFPMLYTDETSEHKGHVWHFNDFNKIVESGLIRSSHENSFTVDEVHKILSKIHKMITKNIPPSSDATLMKNLALLTVLNNFTYNSGFESILKYDDEQYYRMIHIISVLRKNSSEAKPVFDDAYSFGELPNVFLERILL